ncbi:MAG TPA: hypothetical protein VGG01_14745 [Xanthobacteraceae bacterium]|jgi:hypothetical protein
MQNRLRRKMLQTEPYVAARLSVNGARMVFNGHAMRPDLTAAFRCGRPAPKAPFLLTRLPHMLSGRDAASGVDVCA